MIEVAYIFPGQGAQYVGMGKELCDNLPQARAIFDKANEALEFDIKKLCFEGPKEELSATPNCQPAILTVSVAALQSLDVVYSPKFSLGLSLGEYTALVAAGSLSLEDGLRLVRKRGELMDEASRKNPGKMATILGMEPEAVEELCKGIGCEVANLNCPGQVVVSGKMSNVELLASLAKSKGAKRVVMLDVSGPFHSSLMTYARDKLKTFIDKVSILPPKIPFVSNVDAKVHTDPNEIKDNLIKQINSKTLWEESIRTVSSGGIKKFLEIGPGKVLKGLLRKIDSSLEVQNIETHQDLQQTPST